MSDPSSRISYQPTAGLSYDPADAVYWQPEALAGEVHRAFEICHGCRMCFKYCDSFPLLFKAIDERHDGDVHKITAAEEQAVMDACFQCKLCEVQCPYTPRDKHEFQLDFPKLVHRWRGVKRRGQGKTLRMRVLNDPDGAARLARASLGMANVMNRVRPFRILMEKAAGIHRDKLLPEFAAQTFDAWARGAGAGPGRARRRGGAVPDLLRAAQRAAAGARRRRGAEAERGRRPGGARAALLRDAGLGAGGPGVAAGVGAPRPRPADPLRGARGQGAGDQPDLLDDDAARVAPPAGGGGPGPGRAAGAGGDGRLRVPLVDPRGAPLQHRLQEHPAGRAHRLPRPLPPAGPRASASRGGTC